jgi:hypothetical protein
MPVIPVNKVVDLKRKNGGPRRRRGTRSYCPPPKKIEGEKSWYYVLKHFVD